MSAQNFVNTGKVNVFCLQRGKYLNENAKYKAGEHFCKANNS